jgi:hypothetical protein
MNENNLTQSAIEAERKAVDTVFSILLIFIFGLVAFSLGYFIAMSEAAALVKTI